MRIGQYLKRFFSKKNPAHLVVIPRAEHIISRQNISSNALKVLYRLKQTGYAAFLVGGGVRDLLLERTPKDFDVATNAKPEEVRRIFKNCRLIGRRFRLAHVFYTDEIIEVSTFRANGSEVVKENLSWQIENVPHGMVISNNIYGTIEEDAWRRDFTVNSLYYNIEDFSVLDFTQGLKDLQERKLRIIGDPTQRFHEDPMRLLRAIRFAAKLNFSLETSTHEGVLNLRHLIFHVPKARLFDEILKLFFEGQAFSTYQLLKKTGYMTLLFPESMQFAEKNSSTQKLFDLAMLASDTRFNSQQTLNPAYLFAVLLWPVFKQNMQVELQHSSWFKSFSKVFSKTLQTQIHYLMIPRRMSDTIQEIWFMQYKLEKRRPSRIQGIFKQRFFRASVDFLELRGQADESVCDIALWWRSFQAAEDAEKSKMVEDL